MNDRHPSAGQTPTVPTPEPFGHYPAYEQQGTQQGYVPYGGYDTGQWDTSGQWDTTSQWGVTGQTQTWDFSAVAAQQTGQWDTTTSGQWDANAWGAGSSYDTSGQWDTAGHTQDQFQPQAAFVGQEHPQTQTWDTSGQFQGWDTSGQWDMSGQTQTWDTSAYAAPDDTYGVGHGHGAPHQPPHEAPHDATVMTDLGLAELNAPGPDTGFDAGFDSSFDSGFDPDTTAGTEPGPRVVADAETRTMEAVTAPPRRDEPQDAPEEARSGQGRSRRKGAPAKAGYRPRRKALLTVAVPSVAVMGVAGIAAASVSTGGQSDTKQTQAATAPDPSAIKPAMANNKLDTQLASLSKGADDFASRASRTQERIDLKARQEEERKRKAEEAARKEAERPKFALPVAQHGLSAYYGQAGINWMSTHTGIDFPVGYGTPVMAATDGTVRTQYNVAYGNMAIVTSPEGVETWYCHLSSTKLRSGPVKAGDVIAYSGSSGNSTGPHLHFEVRPGGSAVDPLPWLRGQGLDPT
ncbi:M23 family metallopeptidase [Streptomyces syringium]|uniref:M23 family metallopeptidase n=1 Tax=Streptomyces syringium TaxID=76729 RepID=UPI003447B773